MNFFGKMYTTIGHNPSNTKIKAITEMPTSMSERTTDLPRHGTVPGQILSQNCRAS